MTLKVFRYPLAVTDQQTIPMPRGARLLSVQRRESGEPVRVGVGSHEPVELWALVDPDAPPEERRFRVAGTGHPIEDDPARLSFLGSVQLLGGQLVFHVFEVRAAGP